MKVGNFNIHDYLNKLNEAEEQAQEKVKADSFIPDENKRSFDWLKREFEKGKTEVKVEMSSHDFKPGYSIEGLKDFKPGMYGSIKTSENKAPSDNPVKFPETKFPGSSSETKSTDEGKTNNNTENEGEEKKEKKTPKVEVKTSKKKKKKEEKEEKEEKVDESNSNLSELQKFLKENYNYNF
ncbi:MAG: hypothetical protein ACOC1K_01000 [Nanoarchaeota archaeon]